MSVRTSDTGRSALKKTLHHRKLNPDDHKHPVNVVHHDEATFGERLADKISAGIGSWTFLIVQTCAGLVWLTLNNVTFMNYLDPLPLIPLHLICTVPAPLNGPPLP